MRTATRSSRYSREPPRKRLGVYILAVEGSIPDETTSGKGYWVAFGTDASGEALRSCDWIDRVAPNAWAVVAAGTCATYGGIHAMQGNPTCTWR